MKAATIVTVLKENCK